MVRNHAFRSGYDTLCLKCNRERVRAWRKAGNRDSAKESRLYTQRYPEKVRVRMANAQHKRRKRNVSWEKELNSFVFAEAQQLRLMRNKLTGFDWQVDHIIPLKGTFVSGLHVWNNLQVISRSENAKKRNKFIIT